MTGTRHRLGARPQLSADVADFVRDLIVSGQARAGEFLRLDDLADRLGTSVTPVREALLSLRGEGFVELQPRRGFVVAPFTRQDVADVYQVQAYLAGELARRACDRMGDDVRRRLHETQAALESAHDLRDVAEVERLNHDFHRTINLAAGAPKLARFLVTATRYSPRLFFAEIPGWSQASAADHRAVLRAFDSGSSGDAATEMAGHVSRAGELLADHLAARGVWPAQSDEARDVSRDES